MSPNDIHNSDKLRLWSWSAIFKYSTIVCVLQEKQPQSKFYKAYQIDVLSLFFFSSAVQLYGQLNKEARWLYSDRLEIKHFRFKDAVT